MMFRLFTRHAFVLLFSLLFVSIASAQPLTGIKTIGGTNPDYSTIDRALNALYGYGVGAGGVVFHIRDGEYHIGGRMITTSGTESNPIVFGVDSGATVSLVFYSSSSTNFGFSITGSYITFDGSWNGDSNGKHLYINADSVSIGIQFAASPTHDAIKNCVVSVLRTSTTPVDLNDELAGTVYNCDLYGGSQSTGGTGIDSTVIKNCNLIDFGGTGIFVVNSRGVTISHNRIYQTSPSPNDVYGVHCIGVGGALFDANQIGPLLGVSPATKLFGVYEDNGNNANLYTNNFIELGEGFGGSVHGFLTDDFPEEYTQTEKYLFNTVRISGESINNNSSCYFNWNSSSRDTLWGNIFQNYRTGPATYHSCLYFNNGAIPAYSNYNALYTCGDTVNHNTCVARINATNINSLTDLRSLSTWTPRDSFSIYEQVPFVSDSDLHIQSGVPTGIESGAPHHSQVPFDFDGFLRARPMCDIGADEIPRRAQLVLRRPVGGEMCPPGIPTSIQWLSELVSGNVRIELNRNYPSPTWETLYANTPNTGLVAWTPSLPASAHARIRISSIDSIVATDTSFANFTIGAFHLALSHPSGGDSLLAFTHDSIYWNHVADTGMATIKFTSGYPSGDWVTVASGIPLNVSRYSWVVPNLMTDRARIAVISDSFPQLADTSRNNFTIYRIHVVVTQPNGGDTLFARSRYQITWAPNRATGYCILMYNANYPSMDWVTFANGVPLASRSYSWTVPNFLSNNVRIRILPNSFPQYADTSDADFSVVSPNVKIVFPNGGDTLSGNTRDTIRWIPNLAQGLSSIFYNEEYPTGIWTVVANGVPLSNRSFVWTVPGEATTSARIAIVPDTSIQLADTSDSDFEIIMDGVNEGRKIPMRFEITQTYPNPFNSTATIRFSLPIASTVKMDIYDVTGRKVTTLINGRFNAGFHQTQFDGSKLASGIYIVRMNNGHTVVQQKMVLLK